MVDSQCGSRAGLDHCHSGDLVSILFARRLDDIIAWPCAARERKKEKTKQTKRCSFFYCDNPRKQLQPLNSRGGDEEISDYRPPVVLSRKAGAAS